MASPELTEQNGQTVEITSARFTAFDEKITSLLNLARGRFAGDAPILRVSDGKQAHPFDVLGVVNEAYRGRAVWDMARIASDTLRNPRANYEDRHSAYRFLSLFVAHDRQPPQSSATQTHLEANPMLQKGIARFIGRNPENAYRFSSGIAPDLQIEFSLSEKQFHVAFQPQQRAFANESEVRRLARVTVGRMNMYGINSGQLKNVGSMKGLFERLSQGTYMGESLGGIDLYTSSSSPDQPARTVREFFSWCQTHPMLKEVNAQVLQEPDGSPLLTFRLDGVEYKITLEKLQNKGVSLHRLVLSETNLSSLPNAAAKVNAAFKVTNIVSTLFADYAEYPFPVVAASAPITPEVEQAQRGSIFLKEVQLTDEEIEDTPELDQLGGLGSLHEELIQFVRGTVAYARGEAVTKPAPLLLYGETGSGKTTITNAVAKTFIQEDIPVLTISAVTPLHVRGLVDALRDALVFQEEGIIVVNDLEYMLKPSAEIDLETARRELLGIFERINQTRNLTIVANTEHLGAVTGSIEALAQPHRLKPVECRLDETNDAMQDLIKAVTAIYLSQSSGIKLGKNDPNVTSFIESRIPDTEVIADLLLDEYKRARQSGTRLTPGIVLNVFADFYRNEGVSQESIVESIAKNLDQRIVTREIVQGQQLEAVAATLEEHGTRLDRLEETVIAGGSFGQATAQSHSPRLGKRPTTGSL